LADGDALGRSGVKQFFREQQSCDDELWGIVLVDWNGFVEIAGATVLKQLLDWLL
jgi:hypothetical protein